MLSFVYIYQGQKGLVHAESVAQAVDRVEVAYLAKQGVRPQDTRFRIMKKQLTRPWRLNLTSDANIRYRELYRAKKDGEPLSPRDQDFFTKYAAAISDLAALCPSHLRPTGVQ